ncbi:MAG: argininosuccinate synthase [Nitrospinae bacterium]|nr:argininosuccinate synthase [Nitrospinota bacterium]
MGIKTVLAYSGGLDTSVILKWLQTERDCNVIAFAADIGQKEELGGLPRKAKKTGAIKCVVSDLREEFARDFIFPMLRAGAIYEDRYLLGTSIARPLIAKEQVRIARAENAEAVSHGATGKGNDQVRFELTYAALAPELRVIAPWREWDLGSRAELLQFAKKHGIPTPVTSAKPYSSDRNLFHISYEGGVLESPWNGYKEDMFLISVSPEKAPNKPTVIEIGFKAGNPVTLDGKKYSPYEIIDRLNAIGGRNGVGRADVVENRVTGMKSRGVYETPGGTILHEARLALESITLDAEVANIRRELMPRYSRMIYAGYWFAPERILLQSLFDEAAAAVNGVVRLKLYKGNVMVMGRKSNNSLYAENISTFERGSMYDHADATGFIRLNALRLKIRGKLSRNERRK